jgi:Glycosyl transferase family 2
MVSWDILICSVEHRTTQLVTLLTALEIQLNAAWPVGIHVYRDNLEVGYGAKCQALLESSSADYVSFIDDDDMVEPDFIATVLTALTEVPDYVGYKVK